MKKLAFFDFDGTLSRGYISMAFMDRLHESGFYSDGVYKEQMRIFEQHKTGEMNYDEWCLRWGELWAEGLRGKRESELRKHAEEFFDSYKANIYPASYDLVKLFRENSYRAIMVSVGSYDVISLAAKDLWIKEVYATQLEAKDGIYTGRLKTRLHTPTGKEEVLKGFAKRHSLKGSFAFGDSVSDKKMLELVENAVALNPSEELEKLASIKGWKILDHENVVEEMKKLLRSTAKEVD